MVCIPGGAAQVGILAREGDEIHVVWRTVLGIVCSQCHDGGGAGGIVVGAGIEDFTAQIAYMVVMRREHIAAVMPLALHLGDHIEAFIVFEELVVHLRPDALHTLHGLWCHPQNGLVYHIMAISLEELDGRLPCVDESCIGTFTSFLQTRERLFVTIGKPEFTGHQAVGVLGLGKVGKHALGIEVQRVDIIYWECAVNAGGILAHREIYSGAEFPAIGPHLHLSAERVDVQFERLDENHVHSGFHELFL